MNSEKQQTREDANHPFFVIRHSERIDEANPKEWEQILKSYSSSAVTALRRDSKGKELKLPQIPSTQTVSTKGLSPRLTPPVSLSNSTLLRRSKQFFAWDPPLSTDSGPIYANHAAETIFRMLSASLPTVNVRIYSSRLRRAVQTAVPLARRFQLPIYLSYGLSTIIPAVAKADGQFQFQSPEELTQEFPDIQFISCDDRSNSEHYLPTDSWIEAIHVLLRRRTAIDSINIIVGHRETIRGLAGEYMNTPYCAIAMFDRSSLRESDPVAETVAGEKGDGATNTNFSDHMGEADQLVSKMKVVIPSSSSSSSSSAPAVASKPTLQAVSTQPTNNKNIRKATTGTPIIATPATMITKKKTNGKKQRDGPIYRLLQLYDCEGNSIKGK
jgi:broad specificity phosphatase PhoE